MTGELGHEATNAWWRQQQVGADEYARAMQEFMVQLAGMNYTVTSIIHDSICVEPIDPELELDEGI